MKAGFPVQKYAVAMLDENPANAGSMLGVSAFQWRWVVAKKNALCERKER